MAPNGERPDIDLLDPTFHVGDPHPTYRQLRRHAPLVRDRNGIWCVTRMDHVRHVERRADLFVSSRGYRSVWVPTETSMISKDDPHHSRQRKLVADRFTPRAVTLLEPIVREVVQDSLDAAAHTTQFEVVDTVAARVPSILTCRLLGWPDSQWREVRSLSERLMRVDTMATDPAHLSDAIRAVNEIGALTAASVAERRACPADDLLTRWSTAELGGCPMSIDDIVSELGLVIPGGAETTRTTLSRTLVLFSERNDLWEHLAADSARIPTAVEELFRWITPLNNMFRTAPADTTIDGAEINAGERLALIYPSANRDELVFDDPDDVRLDRDPNPHIAFGFGTHFCLGAHLARLTLRIALEELVARYTNLRPVAPPTYEANIFVKAVERYDLAFDCR
jgi:cytochrome P450 family 142 subfamily A polypeptide 1